MISFESKPLIIKKFIKKSLIVIYCLGIFFKNFDKNNFPVIGYMIAAIIISKTPETPEHILRLKHPIVYVFLIIFFLNIGSNYIL